MVNQNSKQFIQGPNLDTEMFVEFSVAFHSSTPHICVRRRRTLPNAVEIDILGIFEGYSSLQIWPSQKIFQGRNYSGRMT